MIFVYIVMLLTSIPNQSTMSVSKQMLINQISSLSYDVKHAIKEFAFYDVKTGKEILRQKSWQVMVNNSINQAITRNNSSPNYFGNTQTSEEWTFYYYDEDTMTEYSIVNGVYNPTYLSSINCSCCGNYKMNGRQEYINRILCLCNQNQ